MGSLLIFWTPCFSVRMSKGLRCVFDTNVLIGALLSRSSVSRRAFDLAVLHHSVLISSESGEEFDEVARRDKFLPYLKEEEREGFVELLYREAALVEVTTSVTACRDPDDNRFLELAVDGDADVLVSGDSDLRGLHPFRGIPIISPREFITFAAPL